MTQPVIQVRGLSKRYQLGAMRSIQATLRESISATTSSLLRRLRGHRNDEDAQTLWAVRDVTFDVQPGEVVGLVGRNGAGKSTLLKILSRITDPTRGEAFIHGRVGSLLEVGTGFHPELTGRENIYLNGAILGMTRGEVRRKFDQIVDFAEIERFLDTPVKRYSSGMFVRLAFAVAAHLEPEILLVDEVLAVGDAAFQNKCLGKMSDVAKHGRTIVFVSHNMAAVRRMCPRSIWIDDGAVRMDDRSDSVIDAYLASTSRRASADCRVEYDDDPRKAFQVRCVNVVNDEADNTSTFSCDEAVSVLMTCQVRRPVPGLYGYLQVIADDGQNVLESDSFDVGPNTLDNLPRGEHELRVTIPRRLLGHGTYEIYLNFASAMADGGFDVDTPGIAGRFTLTDTTTARGDSRRGRISALLPWRIENAAGDRSIQVPPSPAHALAA